MSTKNLGDTAGCRGYLVGNALTRQAWARSSSGDFASSALRFGRDDKCEVKFGGIPLLRFAQDGAPGSLCNLPTICNQNLMLSPVVKALAWFADRAHAMTTTPETTFHYEVDHSEDETKWKVTTITCHGRLVSDNANQIRDLVKPLITEGGHIVLDFADLKFLDSLGLGALVGLKVSAINKGYCKLDLINLSPRVRELLSLTNVTQLFSR